MNFVPKTRLLKSQHATTRPGQQVVSKSFDTAPYQAMKLRVCWQPSQKDINSGTGKTSDNVHENQQSFQGQQSPLSQDDDTVTDMQNPLLEFGVTNDCDQADMM